MVIEGTPEIGIVPDLEARPGNTWVSERPLRDLLARVQREYHEAISLLQSISDRLPSGSPDETHSVRSMTATTVGASGPLNHHDAIESPAEHFIAVYMLGSFKCYLNGRLMDNWRSGKAKALLKYLLAHRERSVSRDEMMEALWPGGTPETSGNSLRVAIHSLRQTLHERVSADDSQPLLYFDDGGYRWRNDVHVWVDVEELEHHCEAARSFRKRGAYDDAVFELEAAEKLYRGPFLEDDRLEEWTLFRREAMRDKYLYLLGTLIDHSRKSEDNEGTIALCLKMLKEDPCQEYAYQNLIGTYLTMRQPARALRWLNLCTSTLRRELDVEPSPETVALCRVYSSSKLSA